MKHVEDYYPITTKEYPADSSGKKDHMSYITDEDLKSYTRPVDMVSLEQHLIGSTRYLEGVYLSDVELWLNRRK